MDFVDRFKSNNRYCFSFFSFYAFCWQYDYAGLKTTSAFNAHVFNDQHCYVVEIRKPEYSLQLKNLYDDVSNRVRCKYSVCKTECLSRTLKVFYESSVSHSQIEDFCDRSVPLSKIFPVAVYQ